MAMLRASSSRCTALLLKKFTTNRSVWTKSSPSCSRCALEILERTGRSVAQAAARAGGSIERFRKDTCKETGMLDLSSVKDADVAAEALIRKWLCKRYGDDIRFIGKTSACLLQKDAEACKALDDSVYWVVNSLDSPEDAANGSHEYTVSIALVSNRIPVLGVVHVPCTGETFVGARVDTDECSSRAMKAYLDADGNAMYAGARAEDWRSVWRHETRVSAQHDRGDKKPPRVAIPHQNVTADIATLLTNIEAGGADQSVAMSSCAALAIVRCAKGEFDVYPRFNYATLWDTFAAQVVLSAAGGKVISVHKTSRRCVEHCGDEYEAEFHRGSIVCFAPSSNGRRSLSKFLTSPNY